MVMNKAEYIFDRLTLLSLCVLIFTLPFSKSMVEIFSITALTFWAVKRISARSSRGKLSGLFRPIDTVLNAPVYCFILAGILSVIFSSSVILSVKGLFFKLLQSILLCFIVAETVNERKKLNLVLITFFLSMALIGSDAIFQFITGRDFIRHYAPILLSRVQASFSNPNGLGGWLTIMIPLALSIGAISTSYWKRKGTKVAILSLALLLIICLLLTYSRGASMGIGLAMIFLCFFRKNKFLIILLLAAIALPFVIPYSIKGRLDSIILFTPPIRIRFWREAVAIIKDFPLFGCGLNTYSIIAPAYKFTASGGTYPHNSYLQMAAETGIIGLASFIWIIFRLFRDALRGIGEIGDIYYKNILLGLSAGMVAFLAHSFFDVNFYSLQLVNLMWFVMGLMVAVHRIADAK